MNAHALAVLEFPRVLDLVAGRASSALGAARVRAMQPSADRGTVERAHSRVAALRALSAELPLSMEPIPDLGGSLERLRVEGSVWTGHDLLAGAMLLRSGRLMSAALRDDRRPAVARAVLADIPARAVIDENLERTIDRAIDDDGEVRDEASPTLRRLRRELRGAQGELVALLERIVAKLEPHQQVADMSVTVRNGRWVIPVRRDARGAVGGIVHDTSATGGTLFVEPPAAVEFANRIRELEMDALREIDRILRELTDRFRPLRESLAVALDALVELDTLVAIARFATEFRCSAPELVETGEGLAIRTGRHPLLVAQGIDVVPFDLELVEGERTLLVSGPNTGGKTVLLKGIALIAALTQCGIPAPIAPASRLPLFDDLFADVGDEQSIEASLSTFSAHLRNLAEILRSATARSLVLVDELGSGTDPLEGAALGGAILEDLTRRGTMTVATTHLGALKELAGEVPGVVNASLQFDEEALAPTYRLVKGIPGRSYGIGIARRLGLPLPVIERAEERLPRGERDYNALLADLSAREDALRVDRTVLDESLADARAHAARLAEREQDVRRREREVERAGRGEARRYLLEARQEVERTLQALRESATAELDEQAREARRRLEKVAGEHADSLAALDDEPLPVARRTSGGDFGVGDWVAVGTLGGKEGRVIERRDDAVVVAVGAMKLTVPVAGVAAVARPDAPETTVVLRGDEPEIRVRSEVDVRGVRVHELDELVLQALDDAIRADLKALRIIHGKGTGALRERVTEMLRKDARVRGFRAGAWNEGGTGVTIVEI